MSPGELTLGPFQLFGKSTTFVVDDAPAGTTLREELAIYPASTEASQRIVRVTHGSPPTGGAVNPALHAHFEDGFLARYPNAQVRFRFEETELVETTVHLPRASSGLRAARSRWRNIQYLTAAEMSGQLVHELALVPGLYFETGMLPIHAAAFSVPDLGMILVGGTGGVGKTTMALDLCRTRKGSFAADDVAVVDERGLVHPNLAYPKIYAYNVQGDPELRSRILGSTSMADRLQWGWRLRRAGPAAVRRRVSPSTLYGSVVTLPAPLRRYVVIAREHRPTLLVEQLSAAYAAEMSVAALQGEYETWHRHLAWETFNALAVGRVPRIRLSERLEEFRAGAERLLTDVDCRIVRVPVGDPHEKTRRQLVEATLAP